MKKDLKRLFKIDQKSMTEILLWLVGGLFLLFVAEYLLRGKIRYIKLLFLNKTGVFFVNYLLLLLITSPIFVLKRKKTFYFLISFIIVSLSVVSKYLCIVRGVPFTFSDIYSIGEGLEIAGNYLTIPMVGGVLIFLLIVISVTVFLFKKEKNNKRITSLTNVFIGIILIIIFPLFTKYQYINGNMGYIRWDITASYKKNGYIYSTIESAMKYIRVRPKGYSKKAIDEIRAKVDKKDKEDKREINKNKPNILFIQLEAFMDPTKIKEAKFSEDPIPNFRNIFNNYTSGLLTIPGLGGGTANSEFEVITGFSSNLFGAGEFPFNTLLSSNTSPSLAYYLKNLGYSSHALHNNDATFYSRYKAYKNLGFDTFTPMECMPNMDKTPMGWAKDTYLTSEIEKLLTNTDTPDLVFAVSVQGHGSYPNSPLEDSAIKLSSNIEISNLNSIEYYVNQLHEMDTFIGELINMVNSLNEPSIVVFYGDHHPAIDVKAEDFVTNSLYTTPYAIWDNLGLEKESIDLKAYELSSYIIKNLNLPKTILTNLHNSTIDEDLKEEYLHLIQYDSLYGKDYLNLNETVTSNDTFTYGVNIPIINSVETSTDSINIKGDNFNVYSKVFVNDTAVNSSFIDNNTLSLGNYKLKTGDIITVKDMAGAGKIELLSSSPFKY